MNPKRLRPCLVAQALAGLVAVGSARAQDRFQQIHSFSVQAGGLLPSNMIAHEDLAHGLPWALYGVTYGGGVTGCLGGCGVVFRLVPPSTAGKPWTYYRIYVFSGGPNDGLSSGSAATGGLTFAADGSAYCATPGSVFRLQPPRPGQYFWTRTTAYTFPLTGESAFELFGGVVIGASGKLYGTAIHLAYGEPDSNIVYELTPPGAGRTGWTFRNIYQVFLDRLVENQGTLNAPLTVGPDGVLYGTAIHETLSDDEIGEVYRLSPPTSNRRAWSFTVLHSFPTGYGNSPGQAGVTLSGNGVLFGITIRGGEHGLGSVFQLSPPRRGQTGWSYNTIYDFSGADGTDPRAVTQLDNSGAIYGVTYDSLLATHAGGVVFKLAPPGAGRPGWTETVLHRLHDATAFLDPGLTSDASGTIYGVRSPPEALSPYGALAFKIPQ